MSGFAGPAVEVSAVKLYDESRVRTLARLPDAGAGQLPPECTDGLLVIRSAARPGAARLSAEQRLSPPPGPIRLSPWAALQLDVLIRRDGAVPVVVTVASHVLGCAGLVGLDPTSAEASAGASARASARATRGRRAHLALRAPGPWAAAFEGRRLVTGAGSPWLLWTPRLRPCHLTAPSG